ncbi:hypothetical protein [Microvirga flavescens]|uniref:hypothetical protein n=1 Tax=Microvirga flavescens TaxID=2249811 RepID=UPI000DD682D7|nr:hypothetical protein [Microvirga flavescens]
MMIFLPFWVIMILAEQSALKGSLPLLQFRRNWAGAFFTASSATYKYRNVNFDLLNLSSS